MTLKDLLKKKDRVKADAESAESSQAALDAPEFTFLRTTTTSQEIIAPPSFPDDTPSQSSHGSSKSEHGKRAHTRPLGFRKSSNAAFTKDPTASTEPVAAEQPAQQLPIRPSGQRRLSSRLHLSGRSRTPSTGASSNLPEDLPDAPEAVALPTGLDGASAVEETDVKEKREAQWEKRATLLAMSNPLLEAEQSKKSEHEKPGSRGRSPSIADKRGDENIQEAIRLHEAGDLEKSTAMFGRLADPKGANNALSQVLYGLALRHGWGITPSPTDAVTYLSMAASNSASIESEALSAGMKKGGAAKGELVLAIFELANCFRHGWGVKKDAVAARQYYETAANLGDTDALDEAAWCYLEGFGGAKDKVRLLFFLASRTSTL